MKFIKFIIIFFIFFYNINLHANEASKWLKQEVDKILVAYQDPGLPNENKFLLIEQTINNNFPGKSIAINIAKNSYKAADEVARKNYINLFKRHLALNIASLLQGYSNQKYELIDSRYDEKNKVNIDMTLTSPNCPVAESLPNEVKQNIKKVEGVSDVNLNLVWEPPWNKDKMSEAAKLELNL